MAEAEKKVQRPRRLFSAYGSLDKRTRHWQYLPPVVQGTNHFPKGENLVYRMNDSTLEIGQGMSGLRGYAGMIPLAVGFVLLPWMGYLGWQMLHRYDGSLLDVFQPQFFGGMLEFAVAWIAIVFVLFVGIPIGFLASVMFVNDVFGYIDAPVRFDRIRRKVYVWSSRKEGPLVLDWDRIKPVAQSVSAPPYQINQFKSVLLVEEDENGDVSFENRIPRIAQIGAALLNGEEALAAYEYVRGFMQRGPQSLPSIKTHLVMRPRGMRPFVDVLGVLGGMMRPYPSLPVHKRHPGWLVFGVLIIALFSMVLIPFQLTHAIAVKWTTRVPKWPEKYDELAVGGGPMLPPIGAEPNDPPLLPHEKLIAGIWVVSCVAWFVFFALI